MWLHALKQSLTHNSLSPVTVLYLLRNLPERSYKGVTFPLASTKRIIMVIYYRIHSCVGFHYFITTTVSLAQFKYIEL